MSGGVWRIIYSVLGAFFLTLAPVAAQEPLAPFAPVSPISRRIDYDRAKALLGKRLFFEPLLSKNKDLSCAACHIPEAGGAGPRSPSGGSGGQRPPVDIPSVYNVGLNAYWLWSGRAETLRQAVAAMFANTWAMAMSPHEVEGRLAAVPAYRRSFRKAYGKDRVDYEGVLEALVEFLRSLVTPDSRFDRFLRGEGGLSPVETRGYHLFKELGCVSCHNGANLGGNSLQPHALLTAVLQDRWDGPGGGAKCDFPASRHELLRVPSLRNAALTAPYFHDGEAASLDAAIAKVARQNLGIALPPAERRALAAFIRALTGRLPDLLAVAADDSAETVFRTARTSPSSAALEARP